ncbi:diguanylate cyclase domain-containing protein [Massilia glaciei]|nr:diguanylate cyclase [Massilia glaciei]
MMKPFSIKMRIVALTIGLLLTLVFFRLIVALPMMQSELHTLVSAQQFSIASYIARDIDHSINARRALLSGLAGRLPTELLADPVAMANWLKLQHQVNPLFSRGLSVIRADGTGVIADYPAKNGRDRIDFAGTEWFRTVLQGQAFIIGKPQRERVNGTPTMIMAASVRDGQNKIIAVLAGMTNLDAPGFLDGLQQTKLGGSGDFLLVAPDDNVFIGAGDPSLVLKRTPISEAYSRYVRTRTRPGDITIAPDGTEELSTVASVPSMGWVVVARLPTQEAYAPIEALRNVMLVGSLVVLLFLLGVFHLMLPRVMRPLTTVARSMRSMADGSTALAPLEVQTNDEVGDLVQGFNHLVACLAEKETALEASEARMAFLAHHDTLTGLYNRGMLEDHLQRALARAERHGLQLAILFCDLDGFKPVNDNFGHDVGDAVLVEVATRLSRGRRRTDTVARQGGDEFVLLLDDLEDGHVDAERLARQCLDALAQAYEVVGHRLALSASIGVAVYHGSGDAVSATQMMARADSAMYRAKRAGKNKICFNDEMTPRPNEQPANAAAPHGSTPARAHKQ